MIGQNRSGVLNLADGRLASTEIPAFQQSTPEDEQGALNGGDERKLIIPQLGREIR